MRIQDYCVAEFLRDQSSQVSTASDPQGYKRQEAIWELFTSECIYFLDQLMVLKEVTPSTKKLYIFTSARRAQINIDQTLLKPNTCCCAVHLVSELLPVRFL